MFSTLSVGACSEDSVDPEVEPVGAGDDVALLEVWEALVGAKCIDITGGSEFEVMRSSVMGTAGLWYFNRTSSWRQNFLYIVLEIILITSLA